MKVQAPFGFVTGCHAGDKFMVQVTLASMRHYCPNVPIRLTVGGDFDVSDLKKQYVLMVLRVSELPFELMCGNLRAKLAALWEGPFEFYVWLDSDAIVWATSLPTSGPTSISRVFGARFPSHRTRSNSHHGWRIFISIH